MYEDTQLELAKNQLLESKRQVDEARMELNSLKEALEKQKIDEKKTRYFFAITFKGYVADEGNDEDGDEALIEIESLVRDSFRIAEDVHIQSRQIFVHDNKL